MNEDLGRGLVSPPPRMTYDAARGWLRTWTSNEVLRPLVEPILHPSRWRIRALGLSTTVGHPLFWVIWAKWLPQPYENLSLRIAMSVLGACLLLFPGLTATPPSRLAAATFTLIFWITLPWCFAWMYFCNDGNTVWLATLGAMFLIYYHLTDWRIASIGSVTGIAAAWVMFRAFGPPTPEMTFAQAATNSVVLAFCWFMALVLGLSSSNLRREQLNYTLGTMGIMAHELRTPLATMQLIGEAVRNEAPSCPPETAQRLELLAGRVGNLVRNMNHQIDMQIANARLMHLAGSPEVITAGALLRGAVADFPYRSSRERDCVVLRIHQDFRFRGSRQLFSQMVDNLMKNALRSLAAGGTAPRPGDLLIEAGIVGHRGRIVFTDNGIGMTEDLQARIFQPFFSTDRGTGHGLGLAFCQRVVHGARGSIRVKSAPFQGAIFTVELPLAD
ncbi:MAG TPA: HAMP domain-containing sensor histidine kinase [Ramlibacter sp.]|uniref:sensor histidine kinase n=1 Tax=Ramlibacter sp. TaxID=1917967 RepID=UPI002C32780F|nr:HAMP domain-containing sensor histidine kinase [Ramlibacter sp.]HVZ42306.1 HAMP domain-containing sensor histidine kinase [Ramlibacter sp.]